MIVKNFKVLIPILFVILFAFQIYRVLFFNITIHPSDLFIFLISIPTLFIVASGARFKISKVEVFLLIYIIASLMASIREPEITSFIGISYFILILFCYMITLSLIKTKYDIEILLNTIIIITVLMSIYIIFEQFSYILYGYMAKPPLCANMGIDCRNMTYGFHAGLMRPRAFFLSYNAFGSFAMAGLFLAYFKAIYYSRFIYYLLFLIVFVAIICTLSRNAILGMSFGIVAYLLTMSVIKGKLILVRNILLISFSTIVIIYLIHYAADKYIFFRRLDIIAYLSIEDYLVYAGDLETASSLLFTHFLAAVEANAETFGLGMGVQQFDDYAITLDYVLTWGSHSNFVTFLGESGIFGFAAQILIIIYLFNLLINVIKTSIVNYKISKEINYYDSLFISLFSAYVGVIFTGLVRTFYFNAFTFIIIALLVLIYRESKQSSSINNTN